jgi:hypothetical protein
MPIDSAWLARLAAVASLGAFAAKAAEALIRSGREVPKILAPRALFGIEDPSPEFQK